MTRSFVVISTIAVTAAVLILVMILNRRRVGDASNASKQNSANPYEGLRNQILRASRPAECGGVARNEKTPWGVVMDWGVSNATATVVAVCDGTASVYLSSGGGSIGGGQGHEAIREAALDAVAVAGEKLDQMRVATSFPLPARQGDVLFYVLTDSGVFTGKSTQALLSANKDVFSKLGNAMQKIITEYRQVQAASN